MRSLAHLWVAYVVGVDDDVGGANLIPTEGGNEVVSADRVGCRLKPCGMCQESDDGVGRKTLAQCCHIQTLVAL